MVAIFLSSLPSHCYYYATPPFLSSPSIALPIYLIPPLYHPSFPFSYFFSSLTFVLLSFPFLWLLSSLICLSSNSSPFFFLFLPCSLCHSSLSSQCTSSHFLFSSSCPSSSFFLLITLLSLPLTRLHKASAFPCLSILAPPRINGSFHRLFTRDRLYSTSVFSPPVKIKVPGR